MSREFSSNAYADSQMKAAIVGDTITPCYFVEITGITGEDDIFLCTHEHDITRQIDTGTKTFVGAGDVMSISRVNEPGDLTAVGLTLQINGLDSTFLDLALNVDYQNAKFRLSFATLKRNANDEIFPDHYVGDPFIVLFSGRIDQLVIQDTGDLCMMEVSIENRLAAFERNDHLRYTDADQRTRIEDANVKHDISFKHIPTIQKRILKWKASS